MISHRDTILSDEIIHEEFVCNLSKCKGACCVEGDSGAPLEEEELSILEDIYEDVKPYLSEKGIKAIEEQGKYVRDSDGDFTTTCIDKNKECAYVIFERGVHLCAIEKAYNDGRISFKKPISCHLYPIRVTKYSDFDALNYNRWHICSDACAFGKELKVPVYKFLKEPLIRKYGEEWYTELEKSVGEERES